MPKRTKPGIIAGRVLDGGGNPVAGARVFFSAGPAALPDVAALTDEGGKFSLSAPAAGSYELQGVADGFGARTVTVEVRAGERKAMDIALEHE